jgi:hypothetical protein
MSRVAVDPPSVGILDGAAMPEESLVSHKDFTGAEPVSVRASRRWVGVIHFPAVVCTSSPSTSKKSVEIGKS